MRTELLAPAGDLERLKVAVMYGADAVYFGGKQFSLRARASNFTLDDIKEAVSFAHEHGSKVYVTVNIIPHNSDFAGLEDYLMKLQEYGVDAIICASQAIGSICKKVAPALEVHISTQQTTINSSAVNYWQSRGADRIVLGREVTYDEMLEIMKKVTLPVEVFIHGGMCANYSGRCTISNVLTNRDANRGGCAQSCRWNYHLWHEDELLDRKECMMSLGSKDMCTIDYIQKLLEAQVCSMKIEGRMKSEYYLATVINAYRRAIDAYEKIGESYNKDSMFRDEVCKTAHRAFTTAYTLGNNDNTVNYADSQSRGDRTFIAFVLQSGCDECGQYALIEMRNRFKVGDTLEVLSPSDAFNKTIKVEKLFDEKGEAVDDAKLVQQKLKLYTDVKLNHGDILRK